MLDGGALALSLANDPSSSLALDVDSSAREKEVLRMRKLFARGFTCNM